MFQQRADLLYLYIFFAVLSRAYLSQFNTVCETAEFSQKHFCIKFISYCLNYVHRPPKHCVQMFAKLINIFVDRCLRQVISDLLHALHLLTAGLFWALDEVCLKHCTLHMGSQVGSGLRCGDFWWSHILILKTHFKEIYWVFTHITRHNSSYRIVSYFWDKRMKLCCQALSRQLLAGK